MSKERRLGSKERIRRFLAENLGRIIESEEIKMASGGASEYARRTRELREDEGWPIETHHDRADLRPGQYFVASLPLTRPDVTFKRDISAALRAQVLARNGFTCQMCGLCPGEIDPETGRKVRLHLGHIKDKSLGGKDELNNLRALCSTCNQGAKNLTPEKPTTIWLLSQVRKSGVAEQKAVFDWLVKKFGDSTPNSTLEGG